MEAVVLVKAKLNVRDDMGGAMVLALLARAFVVHGQPMQCNQPVDCGWGLQVICDSSLFSDVEASKFAYDSV